MPDRFSVVVLSAKTPDHSHIEKYQGARLLRVPVGSGDLASRIQSFERAVRRQLESEDYALAHFTDPFGGYALCELKADYGYRLIYEAQTFPSQELRYTHPQTDGDRRFLSKIRRQELFCLMNADLVVTGSQTTRAYIQGLGAAEDQLRMLRAPVDLQPYDPEVLGVPDGSPLRMMYLGSHVGWQGLPTLLRATALAAQQVDVRLTLVGAHHPDWKPHLDDLVNDLGLKEKVDFQPPVTHDDLVKVLALADVGVLPLDDSERNRLQGGPLAKVSEYLAAGRPVIAADLPVTRELIPKDAAVFFPPGDSRALSERILDLARDVPRRVALGRAGRAFAEKVLDARLIRGQLLDLYDSLLEKRGHVPVEASSEPPDVTMTGTPTNRLASLGMPEASKPAPMPKAPAKPAVEEAAAPPAKEGAEDLPLVMGMALDDGMDTRLVKTEPDMRPDEVPMVMGLPLRESAASPPAAAPEPASTPTSKTTDGAARSALPVPPEKEEPEPLGGRIGDAPQPTEMLTRPAAKPLAAGDDAQSSDTGDDSADAASSGVTVVRRPFGDGEGDAPASTATVRKAPGDAEESAPAATPIVHRPAGDDVDAAPAPTPIVRRPTSLDDDESAAPAPTPIVRRPTSLDDDESAAPAPTPVVRRPTAPDDDERVSPAPTPIVRRPTSLDDDESASPAPTPVVRRPPSPDDERASPAPTPIVRRPADPDDDERASPAPTPIVRRPADPDDNERASPAPTPIVRRPADPDDDEHASPAPTPIVRRPAPPEEEDSAPVVRKSSSTEDEPSASSARRPSSLSEDEERAPTPIVRRASVTRDDESPAPTPIVRRSSVLAEDSPEPPAPTPIVPMRSVLSGARSTGAGRSTRPSATPDQAPFEPPRLSPSPLPMADADKPLIRGGLVADAGRPSSSRPPVLTESDKPPLRGGLAPDADRPPQLPPRATAPPPVPRQGPPPRLLPTPDPQAKTPPVLRPSTPAHADDEPEEIAADEAQSLDDDVSHTPSNASAALDEPEEIDSDEVHDADSLDMEDAEAEDAGPAPAPPGSTLNPWFAQLAHGYCPPEGARFARHTPPTNFPGRDPDEAASPGATPPVGQGAVRGKNS
ncbi:glycosyltransferase [Corallococcus sp. Z5C101001]|uniref:glycosyltransferase family 4 protein n=1 Tax=Corallococcus sp. Z5C101001 TaxID=2596829 RepID=UPI003519FF19